MSTGVIIAIVVAALIVLALVVLLSRKGRERKLESNRQEARELRRGAEVDRASADKTQAEADMKAAEARRHDAEARESAADAESSSARRANAPGAARLDPASTRARPRRIRTGEVAAGITCTLEADALRRSRPRRVPTGRRARRALRRTEARGASANACTAGTKRDVVRDEESRRRAPNTHGPVARAVTAEHSTPARSFTA